MTQTNQTDIERAVLTVECPTCNAQASTSTWCVGVFRGVRKSKPTMYLHGRRFDAARKLGRIELRGTVYCLPATPSTVTQCWDPATGQGTPLHSATSFPIQHAPPAAPAEHHAYLMLGIAHGNGSDAVVPRIIGTACFSEANPTIRFTESWLLLCSWSGNSYAEAKRGLEASLTRELSPYAWVHKLPKINWPEATRKQWGGG